MSTVEISKEERDLWRIEASDECGTPSDEDERILRLINALETTEALLDGSVQETRANFSAVYQACTEIIPELKAKLAAAEGRVKARDNHICTLLREALENERKFDGMKSQWQTSEAQVARLNKMVDWLAGRCVEHCEDKGPNPECSVAVCTIIHCDKATIEEWKEAALKAVEGK